MRPAFTSLWSDGGRGTGGVELAPDDQARGTRIGRARDAQPRWRVVGIRYRGVAIDERPGRGIRAEIPIVKIIQCIVRAGVPGVPWRGETFVPRRNETAMGGAFALAGQGGAMTGRGISQGREEPGRNKHGHYYGGATKAHGHHQEASAN